MPGANAFQVTAFSTLRGSLTNGTITNLDNSGSPFGPGDATVAFQRAISFSGAGSQLLSANVGVGPQSEILAPEPSSIALTALGLLALGFARRRFLNPRADR